MWWPLTTNSLFVWSMNPDRAIYRCRHGRVSLFLVLRTRLFFYIHHKALRSVEMCYYPSGELWNNECNKAARAYSSQLK